MNCWGVAMSKVNFTEENLSKIHISQFEQFLEKHNIAITRQFININYSIIYIELFQNRISDFVIGFNKINGYLLFDLDHPCFCYIGDFNGIICTIYPEYVQGDLTQFHVLFTEVYNEIMSYPINEKE